MPNNTKDFLDDFIRDLLHLEEGTSNRMLDLGDFDGTARSSVSNRTYLLSFPDAPSGELMINTARERHGKPGNQTVLAKSSLVKIPDTGISVKWQWKETNGTVSVEDLHKFIDNYYSELNLKGNNPLFLSVGALRWQITQQGELVTVNSPMIIYPIRLNRGSETSPVEIEFVDDDAYFNPCLITLMRELYPTVAAGFPHPNGNGADFDDALDLNVLSDGREYFDRVERYLNDCVNTVSQQAAFSLSRDVVAISTYNHSDICMYYDVRRNKDKIDRSELVAKVFGLQQPEHAATPEQKKSVGLQFILPHDSIQQKLIGRVASGESLIIKGPPGTGKTLTIANMIAILMSQGKRVMFASKKISALAEVSNKLPENLRKFVLMLAYETEKQASTVNPSSLKMEFRNILRYKREYTPDRSIPVKLDAALRNKTDAVMKLANYYNVMYGKDTVAGKCYYDALDAYFANADLPVIDFAPAAQMEKITAEQLEQVKSLASEAGKQFANLCKERPIKYSPWLNVNGSVNVDETLLPAYKEIGNLLKDVLDELDSVRRSCGVSLEQLTVDCILSLAGQDVFKPNAADAIDKIAKLGTDRDKTETFSRKLDTYRQNLVNANPSVQFTGDAAGVDGVVRLVVDKELTLAQLKLIDDNRKLISGSLDNAVDVEKLLETVDAYNAKRTEARKSQLDALEVFDLPLTEKQQNFILKVYDDIKEYREGDKLGFKTAHTVKKLSAFSSDKLLTADKVIKAALDYRNYCVRSNEEERALRYMSQILNVPELLTEEQYEALSLALHRSKTLKVSLRRYIDIAEQTYELLTKDPDVTFAAHSVTLGEVIAAYELYLSQKQLLCAVKQICEEANLTMPQAELLAVAETVCAALRFGGNAAYSAIADSIRLQIISAITKLNKKCVDSLTKATELLKEVGNKYVKNYYTVGCEGLSVEDLRYFVRQSADKGCAGAAIQYYALLDALCAVIPARKLFEAAEKGDVIVEPSRFAEFVEHNFLHAVIVYRIGQMGNYHNGMGHQAEVELSKYSAAEKEIARLNAKAIEQACLTSIDPDDPDFAFLAGDKGVKYTMRGMFKNYDSAICKLKRCFILSPSTASVLFRTETYDDFDVVIVDEASQLEPVYLVPLLYRSKQCVLVGDEHQMPPITHFKAQKAAVIEDYDKELKLDKNISALSLALNAHTFNYAELTCHYRSNTEALIAFSQKRFYPFMRTFPAARPFGEGLGFTDVYVEEGYCEGGVNRAEAEKALQLLKEHFAKYFDEDSGKLRDGYSVGVVAFGQAQLEEIQRLVSRDGKLDEAIRRAQAAVDVGDKAVFFRTIESVQGQETDHLILSLTYGRDKNGSVQKRFGELNRDDFGQCIFNVAVTRARSSVTVIHSVLPYQLDGATRISFIVDYLRLVQRFAQEGMKQFVSNTLERGSHFVADVVKYIKSLGIDEDRVVVGYGVTEGSVRIPVAVLSEDKQQAELGVWCELPTDGKYDYLDYNLLYYQNLTERNWNLHRISIHDWFDNNEAEKQLLKTKLQQIHTRGNE